MAGFCSAETNPFGPVQAYVAPATVEAVSCSVSPMQTSPPLPAAGVCLSPWTDLEGTGASATDPAVGDPMITADGLRQTGRDYLGGADPKHPLAAPLHRHNREDEYSYVLEGRMGALLGDDVVEAGPGDLVHKPRGQWHTFWNAGDEPCRILEIISPAGFEVFFRELSEFGLSDESALVALNERYGLEMQVDTIPELLDRFGLRMGTHLPGGWAPPR